MRVLALETSTLAGGVALCEDGRVVGLSLLNVALTHSERLMSMVDRLLEARRFPAVQAPLLLFGSDAQKDRFLLNTFIKYPKLDEEEAIVSGTAPDADRDAADEEHRLQLV